MGHFFNITFFAQILWLLNFFVWVLFVSLHVCAFLVLPFLLLFVCLNVPFVLVFFILFICLFVFFSERGRRLNLEGWEVDRIWVEIREGKL